jgi:hypothetical protein
LQPRLLLVSLSIMLSSLLSSGSRVRRVPWEQSLVTMRTLAQVQRRLQR